MEEEDDEQEADDTGDGSPDESELPAEEGDESADEEEREELPEVVGERPESVERAATGERIPAREGYDARRCAHRLCPTIDSPEDGEDGI